MEDTVIVIMLKDPATGFLEKEIASCKISLHEELIVNIYAMEEERCTVHIKLTVDRDVEDWEFSAIYDYYDMEKLEPEVVSVEELEDCYNPTWEAVFEFMEDEAELEKKISAVLALHRAELDEVYAAIAGRKEEYFEPESQG